MMMTMIDEDDKAKPQRMWREKEREAMKGGTADEEFALMVAARC